MRDYIIHLIRHGETDGNKEGKYIGITDLPLNKASAEELENLQEEGIYPSVARVYSSPLSRSLDSSRIIYPEKPLIAAENLMEYNFGDFEGKTDAELEENEIYRDWRAGRIKSTPNGENSDDFKQRIYSALVQIVRDMSDNDIREAAIVTHGGVIMTLLALCGLPQKSALEWVCEAGKGYTIRINPTIFSRSGYVEVVGTIPEM